MPPIPDKLRDPATLELIFHAALTRRDWPAVEAALHILVVVDPHRCRELMSICRVALLLAQEENT